MEQRKMGKFFNLKLLNLMFLVEAKVLNFSTPMFLVHVAKIISNLTAEKFSVHTDHRLGVELEGWKEKFEFPSIADSKQ